MFYLAMSRKQSSYWQSFLRAADLKLKSLTKN
jgi:hypothetical protein